jgi:hypothetical protein
MHRYVSPANLRLGPFQVKHEFNSVQAAAKPSGRDREAIVSRKVIGSIVVDRIIELIQLHGGKNIT